MEVCLPYDINDSDKTIYNLQLTSSWIRSGALYSPFSLFYTIKEMFSVFRPFLSASIYRATDSVYKVSYPWLNN